VSKVLVTIGVIRQTYDHKRSTLEWIGLGSMVSTLTNMVESSFARLSFASVGGDKKQAFASQVKKLCPAALDFESLGKRRCKDVIDLQEAENFISREGLKL
jgi:hypothetical protein